MEEYTYEYLADGELRDVYHRVDNAYRANHLLYYTYDNARRVFLKDVGGLGAYTMYTYDVRDQVIKTMCRLFFFLKKFLIMQVLASPVIMAI